MRRLRTCGLALALALATLLGGCETPPPRPDPDQGRLEQLDQRVARVERVVNNQSLVQLSQRIDALEAQLREEHGRNEELQNTVEGLRKQQRDLYADLDRRLRALEAGRGSSPAAGDAVAAGAIAGGAVAGGAVAGGAVAPGAAASETAVAAAPGAGAADQAAYQRAVESLKAGDYPSAIARFHDFLQTYPRSALDDNAQYWLGEAYYVSRDYEHAAAAFRAVGTQYPQSRKSADALLKLGFTQYELKHLSESRATLQQVVQRYPGTQAARLAAERLGKLPPDANAGAH